MFGDLNAVRQIGVRVHVRPQGGPRQIQVLNRSGERVKGDAEFPSFQRQKRLAIQRHDQRSSSLVFERVQAQVTGRPMKSEALLVERDGRRYLQHPLAVYLVV